MKLSLPAIIFAGGKSSRMGQDKALLPFKPYSTLTEFQYTRLSEIFSKVYISSKKNKFDFTHTLIQDKYEEHSPLIAIVSLFETLPVEKIFILSVDAPFVDQKSIMKIYTSDATDIDVTVAQSPSGIQPLCGIYHRTILSLAKKQLEKGNHKIQDLFETAKTKYVTFENDELFLNLNRPDDYHKALDLIS